MAESISASASPQGGATPGSEEASPVSLSSSIRLKCRYNDDIRVVHVDDSVTIARLRRRLATDFGFQVALRYKDVDGDIILLQTQNDLAELMAGATKGRAVSVLVQALDIRASTTRGSEGISGSTRGSSSAAAVESALSPKYSHLRGKYPPNALSPLDNPPRTIGSPRRLGDEMGGSFASSFRTATRNNTLDRIEATPLGVGGWTSWKMMEDDGEERRWRWQRGGVVGQGAFGSVYQGLNLDTGELMAVKQLPTRDMNKSELRAIEHEIEMMEVLEHENIVRYLGCEAGADHFSIFLEYVPGGSIRDLVGRFGPLDETVVRVYTRQLLLGLEYLHRAGFAHRDIKGANILVANSGRVKVADFGASKRVSNKSMMLSTGIKGTPQWMAPEVIKEQQTDRGWKKADIWSVGCTVIEMATGKPPWSEFTNPLTCMFHISVEGSIPTFPEDLSTHGRDFLNRCLQRQPEKRPDVTSLLLHQFVAFAPTNVAADRLCLSMLDQRRPSTADVPSSRHSSRLGNSRHSSRREHRGAPPGSPRRYPSERYAGGGAPSPIRLPSRASSAAGRVARRRNSLGLGQQLDPTAVPPSRASTAVGLLTKTVQWLNNDEGDEENEDDDDEEDDSLLEDIKHHSISMGGGGGGGNGSDNDGLLEDSVDAYVDPFGDPLASPRSSDRTGRAVGDLPPVRTLITLTQQQAAAPMLLRNSGGASMPVDIAVSSSSLSNNGGGGGVLEGGAGGTERELLSNGSAAVLGGSVSAGSKDGSGGGGGGNGGGSGAGRVDGYWPPHMPITPTPSESPMPQTRRPGTGFNSPPVGATRQRSAGRNDDRSSPPPRQPVALDGSGLVARREAATTVQRLVRKKRGESPQKEERLERLQEEERAIASLRERELREAAMLRASVRKHIQNEHAAVAIQSNYRRFHTQQSTGQPAVAAMRSSINSPPSVFRSSRSKKRAMEEEEEIESEGQNVACVMAFTGHLSTITSLELLRHPGSSSDVAVIASSSLDATVRIWNPKTGQAVHVLEHTTTGSTSTASSSSSSLRSGRSGHSGRSGGSSSSGSSRRNSEGLLTVRFHQQSNSLITGSASGGLWVWPLEHGGRGQRLSGHTAAVRKVCVEKAAGGQVSRLVTAGDDHWLGVWDLRQRRALVRKLHGHTDKVESLDLDSGKGTVVSGSRDKTVRLWDLRTGRTRAIMKGHLGGVHSLVGDGVGGVISAGRDATVKMWDSDGRCERTMRGHRGKVNVVQLPTVAPYGSDGMGRVASGSNDETVRVWNCGTGRCTRVLRGHGASITCLGWPTPSRLVSGAADGRIKLWDLRGGVCTTNYVGHTLPVTCLECHPAAIISGSADCTVRIWKVHEEK